MDKDDKDTVAEFLTLRMVSSATTLLLADMGVVRPCNNITHKSIFKMDH